MHTFSAPYHSTSCYIRIEFPVPRERNCCLSVVWMNVQQSYIKITKGTYISKISRITTNNMWILHLPNTNTWQKTIRYNNNIARRRVSTSKAMLRPLGGEIHRTYITTNEKENAVTKSRSVSEAVQSTLVREGDWTVLTDKYLVSTRTVRQSNICR